MTEAKNRCSGTHWTSETNTLYPSLKRELKQAGCFDRVPWSNLRDMMLVAAAYAIGFTFLLADPDIIGRLIALCVLTIASVHAGFIIHEAGHGIITRRRRLASLVGHMFLTLLTGMNYDEYLSKHRRHHSHCNEKAIVPKGRTAVFSLREEVIENRFDASTARPDLLRYLFNRYQAYLIWFLLPLKSCMVKLDGLRFAMQNPEAGPAYPIYSTLHLVLWFGPPVYVLGLWDALVNYALLTWFGGLYIGTVFLLNHFATRIIRPEERPHYFEQQIVATRNLGSTRLDDFVFGGFNNHIEHHLFPTLPKSKLRTARKITRAFCRKHDIPYRELTFTAAIREIFQHFDAMGKAKVAAG